MKTTSRTFWLAALALALLCGACEDDGSGDNEPYSLPDNPPEGVDDEATVYSGVPTTIDVLDNDYDPEDDDLDVDSVTQPEYGTVTISGTGNLVEFTSADDFVGTDSFDYVLIDEGGNTASATVTVEVIELPTVEILTPEEGAIIEGNTFEVTWEVTGCEVTSPQNNPDGCHLHRYLDRENYSDDDSSVGWYGPVPFDLVVEDPGPHELEVRIHKNDGTDGAWDPETTATVNFCIETCDEPKDPKE